MIAPDSPLCRIPLAVDAKQAIFFDAIRHAVEIADFAHSRLKFTLGGFAEMPASVEGNPEFARALTSALLDAWTVVDAVHRFVGLKRNCPGMEAVTGETPAQKDLYYRCGKLRNLTDHLHGTIPQLVARKSAAMGVLRWHTRTADGLPLVCLLMPGTSDVTTEGIDFAEAAAWGDPLGPISLQCGQWQVYLEDLVTAVEADVRAMEGGLLEPYAAVDPSIRPGDKFARITTRLTQAAGDHHR